MKRILIVGCGGIGSRHLQALSNLNLEAEIFVVDKSSESIEKARLIYDDMPRNKLIKKVIYSNSLDSIDFDVDIAIIATNSNNRKNIIQKIFSRINVKYFILEKIAFQSVNCFEEVISLLKKNNSKAWVNCVNRIFPAYIALKEKIINDGPLNMVVEGGDWEISGNCIHYIDLFNFLTDKNISSFNTDGLEKKYYPSKRKGFIDFNGEIIIKAQDGSKLTLLNDKTSNRSVMLNIFSNNYRYIIFEHESKGVIQSTSNDWMSTEISFPIVPQSKLTNLLVEDIINNNKCNLSTIEESFLLHKPILISFSKLLGKFDGEIHTFCPIT